jgi:hypothetical protein
LIPADVRAERGARKAIHVGDACGPPQIEYPFRQLVPPDADRHDIGIVAVDVQRGIEGQAVRDVL